MSEQELWGYRKALEAKRAELDGVARKLDAIVVERVADEMDQLSLAADRDREVTEINRQTLLLAEVRHALERIDDGSYGVCLECGGEIRPARLRALPWAAFCIACQERMDHQRGSTGLWTGAGDVDEAA